MATSTAVRRAATIGVAFALIVVACTSEETPAGGTAPAALGSREPIASTTSTISTTSPGAGGRTTSAPVTPTTSAHRSSTTASTSTTVPPLASAEAIAGAITASERGIRDESLSVAAVAEHGRDQQRAYRALARHPQLQDAVSALVPEDVAEAFSFNVAARQAVVDHAAGRPPSDPPATLPAWTIVDPPPIDELLAHYREAEAATGVPWEYLAAIHFVETRMGRIVGESSAGAIGPMQFLPTTWAACCTGDVWDPRDAILGAATYLVQEGAPDDMAAALHAYNPNAGYVGSVTAYAANLRADPLAYRGYHAWEVYVGSAAGTIRLPVGYRADEPVDALAYAAAHPEDVL